MSSNNYNNIQDTDNSNQKLDNINKKQKLDSNNVGLLLLLREVGEIDITNLSKQTVVQLKGIASSIGLSIKSGTRKNDIIEMIKSIYKRKQEIIAKEVIDSNINSFNKGIIEYTIKDGVEGSEWSFWKIFRNKFIYRRIMSFMDTHLSIPYDSIVHVDKMIQSNQLEILRDKINRNQYLVFGKGNGELLNPIFRSFKSNCDDNMLFYQNLFKYYGHYSLNFNNVMVNDRDRTIENKENGREQLVNTLIELKCLPAILVLIQEYQYEPTINNLNHAIKQGSLKFIKLLLQPQFNLNGIISQSESVQSGEYSFKSLHYFSKEYTNIFNSVIDKLSSKSNYFDKFGIQINKDSKLKHLIIFCKIFLKSNLTTSSNQSTNNNNIGSTEEIDSFSNSLPKQELKLSITDNLFHLVESSSKKEFIKKLLDLYFNHMIVIDKPIFYNLHFNDGSGQIYNTIAVRTHDFIMSFKLANFKLLQRFKNHRFKDSELAAIIDCLFSNCQHDKSKQMEFIKQVIPSIHSKSILFFYMVIGNDDIDQIRYVSNELECKITFDNSNYIEIRYSITHFIKSTLVLEWLFENHLSHFANNESIWFFKNVQLLQHYQQLYSNKFGNSTPIKLYRVSDGVINDKRCSLINYRTLEHIFKSGPMVYQFDVNFNNGYQFIMKCFANADYSCQDKVEIYKLDYLNYNGEILMKSRIKCSDYTIDEMYLIKFLDWLYLNHNNGFNELVQQISKPNKINPNIIKIYLLFKIGRYNDESILLDSNTLCQILLFDYKDNIGILNLVLNYLKLNPDFSCIYSLLFGVVGHGRLKSIEFIEQHHNWILKPKSNSNPIGRLPPNVLNQLLGISFQNNNIKLSEFLFHLFKLSKVDYKRSLYSAQVSMVYFRDKIKF